MSNFGDMTPQYLDRIYDELSKEQMRLMTDFKTDVNSEMTKDLSTQKQLTLLNTIMMSVLRLRNLKKKNLNAF